MRSLLRLLAVVVLAAILGTAAPAAPPGSGPRPTPAPPSEIPDPVNALRQALQADPDIPRPDEPERKTTREAMLAHRKRTLERLAARLRTPRDLNRALVLRDWRYLDPDTDVAESDFKVFRGVEDHFQAEFKKRVGSGNRAIEEAAANLIGELSNAVPVPPSGGQGNLVRRFLVDRILPDLLRLAKSPDGGVQAAVARALGKIQSNSRDVRQPNDAKTRSIFATLRDLENSPSVEARRGVADGLAVMLQYYSPQEKDPKPVQRPTDPIVLERIVFEILDNVVPVAFRGLTDADAAVRRQDLDTLQRIVRGLILEQEIRLSAQSTNYPPRGRTPTADEAKRIRDDRTALNAELALLRPRLQGFDAQARTLRRVLEDRNATVRTEALRLTEDLALLNDRIRQRILAIPTLDEKGRVAARLVGRSAQPAPPPPGELLDRLLSSVESDIVQRLRDPRARVRLAAVNLIENLGPESRDLGPQLVQSLRDPNAFVRWVAARALGKIGSPAVPGTIEGLGRLTHDADLSVRAAVAVALEQFGSEAATAVPDLLREANRGDAEVRQLVLKALGTIAREGKRAVPLIARELTNTDVRVRRAAAEALSRFGSDVALATGPLERALRDDDADVRRAAAEALLNVPVK